MDLPSIEAALREKLEKRSVQDIDGFPSSNYSEFCTQYRAGRLQVLTKFDPSAFNILASSGERFMNYMLTNSPVVASIILVVASVVQWNFWLLLGVPLAFLGVMFTTPGLMRNFGYGLLLLVGGFAVYSWFQGNCTAACILAAYAVPNFLAEVAREQCGMVIRETIGKSEIVLVWLLLKGTVALKKRNWG